MNNNYPIGVALPTRVFNEWDKYGKLVTDNFNSFTCENEMKPEAILVRPTNGGEPSLRFDASEKAVSKAVEVGAKMRLHTLVWHSQTPAWFFTEDYTDDGALVGRDVMLGRMEWYIKSVLDHFGNNYPDLFYAVDVVNEAYDVGDGDEDGVRKKNSKWYETIGPDFVYYAFVYARKYAPAGMKLFYNDYSCMYKPDIILRQIERSRAEHLIDGIGMQTHLDINTDVDAFIATAKRFCDAGYEVQLTEIDVGVKEPTEENFIRQGEFYRRLTDGIKSLRDDGYGITSLTVWGISDGLSWRWKEFPLLFDKDLRPKPAYHGFFG